MILLCVAAVGLSLALPSGFAGWDDLHYVQAAQRWLSEGVNIPANHWATRLPYVLTIAASLRLFGLSEFALTLPNTILFLLMLLLVWRMTQAVFPRAAGPRAGSDPAFAATLVAATTPLFLRMPTTYYPEVMETVFAACATVLTLEALRRAPGRSRAIGLVAAGLLGGCGILVRQTALGIPVALSLLIFLRERDRLREMLGSIGLLAAGYAVPVAAETLFYLVMTGNPMERLVIDSRHVLIPSIHLDGRTFSGGSPLFNWKLASQWDVPSVIRLHWTVNPLLRVFTSPGLLLTPFLCVAGGIMAFRSGGPARQYAIFAGFGFLIQHVLNTFVLVIAPDTRYFSSSIVLALPLAGFVLSFLPRQAFWLGSALLLLAPCVLILALAPTPAHLVPKLAFYASHERNIHISHELDDAATLLFANRPDLANRVIPFRSPGEVPVGSLAVIDSYGWTEQDLARSCPGGRREWIAAEPPPPPAWVRSLPTRLQAALTRKQDQLSLARRVC